MIAELKQDRDGELNIMGRELGARPEGNIKYIDPEDRIDRSKDMPDG